MGNFVLWNVIFLGVVGLDMLMMRMFVGVFGIGLVGLMISRVFLLSFVL